MGEAVIYHGTPMTPNAAFDAVMPGRAACVSFFRPDQLRRVLAACPYLMFRSGRLLNLDGGASGRCCSRGRGEAGMVGLSQVARSDAVAAGAVGDHPRYSLCSVPAQRRASERLALWAIQGRASLAHGRPDRAARQAVRALRSGLSRLDRRSEAGAGWMRCIPPEDGRGCPTHGESLAPAAHAARDQGGVRLPVHRGGQHQPRAERAPL